MRSHIFAIVLALFVGCVYAGPDFYHTFTPGYQGIIMADSGDADYYYSVINKSYDSVGVVRDPFHYEYRNIGHPFQYFPIEYVLGKTGALLHLRIDQLAIAAEFFFPALLTLLMYAIGYYLSRNRLTAFALATTMLLGTELVHPNGISNLFNTFVFNGSFREFLTYSRPVNPQVSGIFFFAALAALLYLLRNPASKRAVLFAGVGLGLLAYIYPYFWLFVFVVFGVMGLYALLVRDWKLLLALCSGGVVAGVMMAPFLFANLSVFMHGGGSLAEAIPTHRIIIEKVILLPLFIYTVIFVWGWWSRGRGKVGAWTVAFAQKYLFVLFLLVAGLIVSNHQVIDGKMFYQLHFHFFTNIPVFVFSLTVLLMELLLLVPKIWRMLAVAGVFVVCAWFALGIQVSSYRAHSEESARYQALAPLFNYLRAQGRDKVLFTNYYLSTRLTIYTQDFAYSGAYDTSFLVPQEQLRHDYFVTLALRGIRAEEIRSYLYAHKAEAGGLLFIGTYWRDLCGSYTCFSDSVLDELVPQYKVFLLQPLTQAIRTHKIDYLLLDSKAEPEWRLAGLVQTPPVFKSGDFALYAIRH